MSVDEKRYSLKNVLYAKYVKKNLNNKSYDVAPFIIRYKNSSKLMANLFDCNLIGIINEFNKNEERFMTEYHLLYNEYAYSNVDIQNFVTFSEAVLKMGPEDEEKYGISRSELLCKNDLDVSDVIKVYDFVCEHTEIFEFDYSKCRFVDDEDEALVHKKGSK